MRREQSRSTDVLQDWRLVNGVEGGQAHSEQGCLRLDPAVEVRTICAWAMRTTAPLGLAAPPHTQIEGAVACHQSLRQEGFCRGLVGGGAAASETL